VMLVFCAAVYGSTFVFLSGVHTHFRRMVLLGT